MVTGTLHDISLLRAYDEKCTVVRVVTCLEERTGNVEIYTFANNLQNITNTCDFSCLG